MIHNLYIFDRKGACLYYKEWNRPVNSLSTDPDEEKRLMFGMLYSIKGLVTALGSRNVVGGEGLNHLRTNAYTLHHYETASGLRFVINTDNSISDLRAPLRHLYANVWVEHIIKNPQYRPGIHARPPVTSAFEQKVEEYVTSLPGFR